LTTTASFTVPGSSGNAKSLALPPEPPAPSPPAPGPAPSKLTEDGVRVAVLVVCVWLAGLAWLVVHVNASAEEWSRMLVILSSLEAVAFAAAGALFGTSIQQRRVQETKADAENVRREAKEAVKVAKEETKIAHVDALRNASLADRGKALAAVVKATTARPALDRGLRFEHLQRGELHAEIAEDVSGGGGGGGDDDLSRLRSIAAELFPDESSR
jgi:hypothetical protein